MGNKLFIFVWGRLSSVITHNLDPLGLQSKVLTIESEPLSELRSLVTVALCDCSSPLYFALCQYVIFSLGSGYGKGTRDQQYSK